MGLAKIMFSDIKFIINIQKEDPFSYWQKDRISLLKSKKMGRWDTRNSALGIYSGVDAFEQ
jgi:hypothetical protein